MKIKFSSEYVITAAHCCIEGHPWRLKNSTKLEIGFALGAYYDETCSRGKTGKKYLVYSNNLYILVFSQGRVIL